ncbi:MAG: protein arginine kinase [Clostridia bacterium]|nr:protein arginine kinase [Clostridia bacterium]
MNKWYIRQGKDSDVVLSTRVRLARNVADFPFVEKLDDEKRMQLNEQIRDVILPLDSSFSFIEMKNLNDAQKISMVERHLISPEYTTAPNGRALILSDDEDISIMLNEEDHIRLQVMEAGFALDEAYEKADKIDSALSSKLNIAFDERLGYLTQCITNLGTGMRASLMLHLPALTKQGVISRLASTVSKLGLTIRGAYGEGTSHTGDIYQLSNQITLGISEKEALINLASIAKQIIEQERNARKELVENEDYKDSIWRAYAILKYARKMSCAEFMHFASLVRVGVSQNILEADIEKINELTVSLQPATINARRKENLPSSKRDVIRAEEIREALGG